ncbi:MAG TPA: holo-ACP synthase [Rhodospirillales bacterium]|jgi:holo-[acyl-carrier protein] synthase|nr:holo-ACP synthase [Rhodospirillales bacterium]
MILGIGTDLCDIRRMERALERFGGRFTQRIYAESEQAKADKRPNPAASYALGFAAKEACAKALGTGFRQGVFWRDLVVANHPTGQPYMILSGGAKARLDSLVPKGMAARIDVTQTDEYPMAQAVVIISAERPDVAP